MEYSRGRDSLIPGSEGWSKLEIVVEECSGQRFLSVWPPNPKAYSNSLHVCESGTIEIRTPKSLSVRLDCPFNHRSI